MAPPSNRRPGYSRRAQYSTFFSYLAGALGALVGAALLIVSIWNPRSFSSARTTATQAVQPAGGLTAEIRSIAGAIGNTATGFVLAGTRHDQMRRELAVAKVRLVQAAAVEAENRRLRKLLGLANEDDKPVAITRLTGSSASSTRRFAIVPVGRNHGVEPGMPVRSILGLVGRVLEVGPTSARVLLVTDTESVIPVRRARDDVAAFAQGRGDGSLHVRLIDLGLNPLKPGDALVTSGAGGLYRGGIAVAIVTQLTADGAVARVLANPAAADFVIIERADPAAAPPPPAQAAPNGAPQ